MRRPRLYCPDLSTGIVTLPPEESNHAAVSLRLKICSEVILFDGIGNEGEGVTTETSKRATKVDVRSISQRPFELFHRVTLAVAMGRTHRQGYLIEKCTELGVAGIQPIIAERSVAKPDRGAVEKWTRRAIEACKQSSRAWIPTIREPISFLESLAIVDQFDVTVLAQPSVSRAEPSSSDCTHTPTAPPFASLLASLDDPSSILVWIGPEGGWSQTERQQALDAGARLSSLAPTILRTETAAIATCAAAAMDHETREGNR